MSWCGGRPPELRGSVRRGSACGGSVRGGSVRGDSVRGVRCVTQRAVTQRSAAYSAATYPRVTGPVAVAGAGAAPGAAAGAPRSAGWPERPRRAGRSWTARATQATQAGDRRRSPGPGPPGRPHPGGPRCRARRSWPRTGRPSSAGPHSVRSRARPGSLSWGPGRPGRSGTPRWAGRLGEVGVCVGRSGRGRAGRGVLRGRIGWGADPVAGARHVRAIGRVRPVALVARVRLIRRLVGAESARRIRWVGGRPRDGRAGGRHGSARRI